MKKIILSTISLIFSLIVFSQGSVKFYTNNGSKEVKNIKCGDFDNLKVKVKIPSNIAKYDKVTYKVYLSSNESTSAGIRYIGKGAISTLKPNTTMEKWIVSPGQKGGDFIYSDGAKISTHDLCDVPRKYGLSSIDVEIQLVGYNQTGTETYWDKWDKVYKTRKTYNSGLLIASGKITVEQLPAQTAYFSSNGLLSVEKATGNAADVDISGDIKSASNTGYQFGKSDFYEKITVSFFGGNENAAVDILMYSDEKMNEEAIRIAGEVPSDYNPLDELKRDLLQTIAFNSYRGFYRQPFFKYPHVLNGVWCPNIIDLDDKKKKKAQNFFTNLNLWKKEKIGEYEFDVLRLPEVYNSVSLYHYNTQNRTWYSTKDKNDVPGELVVYAIKRGNYSVFILPYSMSQKVRNSFIINDNSVKDFINKTIASIKFLK